MLKTAFSDSALRRTQTFEWLSRFKHGDKLVEVCEHWHRPSTGRTDENMEIAKSSTKTDEVPFWILLAG